MLAVPPPNPRVSWHSKTNPRQKEKLIMSSVCLFDNYQTLIFREKLKAVNTGETLL